MGTDRMACREGIADQGFDALVATAKKNAVLNQVETAPRFRTVTR